MVLSRKEIGKIEIFLRENVTFPTKNVRKRKNILQGDSTTTILEKCQEAQEKFRFPPHNIIILYHKGSSINHEDIKGEGMVDSQNST